MHAHTHTHTYNEQKMSPGISLNLIEFGAYTFFKKKNAKVFLKNFIEINDSTSKLLNLFLGM
jgi:hypothetical protein